MHSLIIELFEDERYFVQGGGWRASALGWVAYNDPDAMLWPHTNMVNVVAKKYAANVIASSQTSPI